VKKPAPKMDAIETEPPAKGYLSAVGPAMPAGAVNLSFEVHAASLTPVTGDLPLSTRCVIEVPKRLCPFL